MSTLLICSVTDSVIQFLGFVIVKKVFAAMYGLICLLEMNRAVYMLPSWSEIALSSNFLQYTCSSLQVFNHSHDLQLFVLGLTALHAINVNNI